MWSLDISVAEFATFFMLAFAASGCALLLCTGLARWAAKHRGASAAPQVVFVFDGEDLLDASSAAHALLDLTAPGPSDLGRLVQCLAPRFPDLHAEIAALGPAERQQLKSADGHTALVLHSKPAGLMVALCETSEGAQKTAPDAHSFAALFDELKAHRSLSKGLPFPIWRQTVEGVVLWGNADYHKLVHRAGRAKAEGTQIARLFPDAPRTASIGKTIERVTLDIPTEAEPRSFELKVNWTGGDIVVAAMPVDRIVKAERNLNGFVQTLTQTFAHLNVGLAVFSKTRELVVFNPALTDLLDLPAEFLITRPTLFDVFARMRNQRMVPEPKDHKSWRERLDSLDQAAADEGFSETWSLVDGRVFRVVGRPHPEGAIALLFEDISREITLERRFRADLQLGNAVIDGLAEAIAVFAPSGQVMLANRAYYQLWHDGAAPPEEARNLIEFSRRWQALCVPSPLWGDVRDFSATFEERAGWTAEARLRDGGALACRFDALPGGYTLVGFTLAAQEAASIDAPAARISA